MGAPITKVELYPIRTARRTGSVSSHVLVELRDAEGNIGWGELSDLDVYRTHMPSLDALYEGIQRLVIGHDPAFINGLHQKLRGLMPFYWRDSNAYPPFTVPGQLAAAVEMACLDITGKRLGVPVHVLFGGKLRDEIPIVYPLFGRTGLGGIPQMMEQVDDIVRDGVTQFRYYVSDLVDDLPLVQELSARSDIELAALDFGSKFRPKAVVGFVGDLEDVPLVEGVAFPGDYHGLSWARSQLRCDVSEHVSSTSQAMQMLEADAVDVFNVSVVSGGLSLAHALVQIADAAGLKTIVGTTQELGLGTAAGLHLGATLPQLEHPCDPAGPLLYAEDVLVTPLAREGGKFAVPSAPGLGVEIDRDQLERLSGSLVEWQNAPHGEKYVPR